jgi:integrase/recombinase XerC
MHTLQRTTTTCRLVSPCTPVSALSGQPQSPAGCAAQRRPTLVEAIHDYVIHLRAAGRAAATIESYGKCLQVLADSLGIAAPLAALSEDLLDAAVAGMAGTDSRGLRKRLEPTLNRYRSTYRSFCQWAFETGRVAANPASRLRSARVDSAPTAPITPEETRRFLSVIRCSNDPLRLRDEALFCSYAVTGMRRSEVLQLDVSDFDSSQRILRVKAGKGGRWRTVPVVERLGWLLENLREVQSQGDETGAKLFPGRVPGKGLSARQAQARFELWKAAAGLRPELSIHSFRAGFATALHRGSRDLILVARALGHRDLRPTLRYVELDSRRLSREIENSFAGVV